MDRHLETLNQELSLLKHQLLPSTEILHFLIQKPQFNIKTKLTNSTKTTNIEAIELILSFKLTEKANSVTHQAEIWKMSVKNVKAQTVLPENTAHKMLHIL